MAADATRCPHCHQPTFWAGNDHRPFCSERCRLIDLGAWVDERYRIPEQLASPDVDDEEKQQ